MEDRKFVKDKIMKETSPWTAISAEFTAEKYEGSPLLDTNVQLKVPDFCITWDQREKLMKDLAEVIGRYII